MIATDFRQSVPPYLGGVDEKVIIILENSVSKVEYIISVGEGSDASGSF